MDTMVWGLLCITILTKPAYQHSTAPLNQQKQAWCRNTTVQGIPIFNNGIGCMWDLQITALGSSRVLKPALLCTSMPPLSESRVSWTLKTFFFSQLKNCLATHLSFFWGDISIFSKWLEIHSAGRLDLGWIPFLCLTPSPTPSSYP